MSEWSCSAGEGCPGEAGHAGEHQKEILRGPAPSLLAQFMGEIVGSIPWGKTNISPS